MVDRRASPDRRTAGTSPFAIGEDKLSISITQKTEGDLIVSNYVVERYFPNTEDAAKALQGIIDVVAHAPVKEGHRGT